MLRGCRRSQVTSCAAAAAADRMARMVQLKSKWVRWQPVVSVAVLIQGNSRLALSTDNLVTSHIWHGVGTFSSLIEWSLFPGRLCRYEMHPVNDRKSHSSWGKVTQQLVCGFTCRSLHLCVFFQMQSDTNSLSLFLSAVVVAAEPLVRGLRKLPEDIDWSYSGQYEPFFWLSCVQQERSTTKMTEIHRDLRCFLSIVGHIVHLTGIHWLTV